MLTTDLAVSPRLLALLDRVHVHPGGLAADTAGETYEEDNPASLARTLGATLYQTIHNGRDKPLQLAMRTFRDPVQERALLDRTPQRTREVHAQLVSVEPDRIVEVDGVRVRVPGSDDAGAADEQVGAATSLLLPSARPGLSPGFLYMFGQGTPNLQGPILRVYAHVADPESAPALWGRTVEVLEELGVRWHAKVLSARALHPRYDGIVVYLSRDGWRHVPRLAEALEETGLLGTGQSPFTRPVTDGVSCAFEPTDRRDIHRGTSFGQHRAAIFAQALVAHAAQEGADSTPEALAEALYAACLDAEIDPSEPARNLSSPATSVLGID